MKTKEGILEIAKQIGISKGCRIDFPEDWYSVFSIKEFNNHGISNRQTNKFHHSINDIVRDLFPDFQFLEWKFTQTRRGYWDDKNNMIKYLNWLEKEMGWEDNKENWYQLSSELIRNTGGPNTGNNKKWGVVSSIPKILYPNYDFDIFKFRTLPNGYWDDFEILKKILLKFNETYDRMPTYIECMDMGIQGGVLKHGGHNNVAKKLNMSTLFQMQTLSGSFVKSSYEVFFANFCHLNNISFEYETKIIDGRSLKCDFKIGDIFFEIWGELYGEQGVRYAKNRKIKEEIYIKHNLKFIGVEREMFDDKGLSTINETLINLMIQNNIKEKDFYCDDIKKLGHFESYTKSKTLSEIKKECEKRNFNNFPTFSWLNNNGFSRHVAFLRKTCRMSIYDMAKEIGVKDSRKPANFWKDFSNVEEEVLKIIKEIGKFPSNRDLKIINGSLRIAIIEYHGGFRAVKSAIIGKQNAT